jgi:Cys-rich peptide (TIGR04165 family)
MKRENGRFKTNHLLIINKIQILIRITEIITFQCLFNLMGEKLMKAEEFGQKCPKCGSKDKSISTVKNPTDKEKMKEAGIEDSTVIVGSIRCDACGHLFEYCKDRKCVIEVKKISID